MTRQELEQIKLTPPSGRIRNQVRQYDLLANGLRRHLERDRITMLGNA